MHVTWTAYLNAILACVFVLQSALEIQLPGGLSEFCEKYLTWEYLLD